MSNKSYIEQEDLNEIIFILKWWSFHESHEGQFAWLLIKTHTKYIVYIYTFICKDIKDMFFFNMRIWISTKKNCSIHMHKPLSIATPRPFSKSHLIILLKFWILHTTTTNKRKKKHKIPNCTEIGTSWTAANKTFVRFYLTDSYVVLCFFCCFVFCYNFCFLSILLH